MCVSSVAALTHLLLLVILGDAAAAAAAAAGDTPITAELVTVQLAGSEVTAPQDRKI